MYLNINYNDYITTSFFLYKNGYDEVNDHLETSKKQLLNVTNKPYKWIFIILLIPLIILYLLLWYIIPIAIIKMNNWIYDHSKLWRLYIKKLCKDLFDFLNQRVFRPINQYILKPIYNAIKNIIQKIMNFFKK